MGKGELVGRRGRGAKMRKNRENYLNHLYYVEFLRIVIDRGRDGEGGRERRYGGWEERVCVFEWKQLL